MSVESSKNKKKHCIMKLKSKEAKDEFSLDINEQLT